MPPSCEATRYSEVSRGLELDTLAALFSGGGHDAASVLSYLGQAATAPEAQGSDGAHSLLFPRLDGGSRDLPLP